MIKDNRPETTSNSRPPLFIKWFESESIGARLDKYQYQGDTNVDWESFCYEIWIAGFSGGLESLSQIESELEKARQRKDST